MTKVLPVYDTQQNSTAYQSLCDEPYAHLGMET